jgi:hypothetical protein
MKKSIIVWKDGTYKNVDGQTWEYEYDENWLLTIPIESESTSDLQTENERLILEKIMKECDKTSVPFNSLREIKSLCYEALSNSGQQKKEEEK